MRSLQHNAGAIVRCGRWIVNSFITQYMHHIRTVQELLGYKDVKTTQIYTHVLNQNLWAVQSPADEPQGDHLIRRRSGTERPLGLSPSFPVAHSKGEAPELLKIRLFAPKMPPETTPVLFRYCFWHPIHQGARWI